MRRRQLLAALGIAAALPRVATAQGKPARIGLLWLGARETAQLKDAFVKGLREHDLVEGVNVSLIDRTGVEHYDGLREAANELVRAKVDVIVSWGQSAPRAALTATATIPIVAVSPDPVGAGFAKSLSRPGGNVTGFASLLADLQGKRLELLKETIAGLRRVAVLLNPDSGGEPALLRVAEDQARRLELQLGRIEVRKREDLEPAFAAARSKSPQALFILPNTMFMSQRDLIAALALRYRLPSIATVAEYAESGALFAYGENLPRIFRRAAGYVARILKGEKPAEMPIEQPTEFDLVVNMRTAHALGIRIPESILVRATRLIE